jgi:hypothetical protein
VGLGAQVHPAIPEGPLGLEVREDFEEKEAFELRLVRGVGSKASQTERMRKQKFASEQVSRVSFQPGASGSGL